jgi:hypothetical protein
MRVHLSRVVVSGLVVVEMHVRHRSGDGAHLNGNGQDGRETSTQQSRFLTTTYGESRNET